VDKLIAVLSGHGRGTPPPGVRCSIYAPVHEGASAVWCIWGADAATLDLHGFDAAYLVDERPQWEDDPHAGITRFSFLRAASGLTRDEFARHWRDVHAPLARRHHPALRRYVQNVVRSRLTPDAPEVDGIAELTFLSAEDMRDRMYDSDEGRRVIGDDIREFIDLASAWRVVGVLDSNAF
jgi:uncharacterized protein (TIGR02118 family)